MIRMHTWFVGGLLAAALVASPARSAPVPTQTTTGSDKIDKFMPDDTEVVVSFNIRQFLDSATVKKIGLDKAKDALKEVAEVGDVLKALGFDPFTDLDSMLNASPASVEPDKGLIIVHGKFDLAKFKAKADDAAKDNADIIKVHKSGTNLIYEIKVTIPGQDETTTLFVALANKTTLLASPGKDYVVDALKREGVKSHPGLKSKQMQAMIEKMDAKQTLSIAMVTEGLAKANIDDETIKGYLAKIDAVSGGLTITDEVKLEIGVTAKNADDAKELNKEINDGVNQLTAVLALVKQPELEPVLDFLKTIKATAKEKSVTVKGRIEAESLDKAIEALKKALNKKDF